MILTIPVTLPLWAVVLLGLCSLPILFGVLKAVFSPRIKSKPQEVAPYDD